MTTRPVASALSLVLAVSAPGVGCESDTSQSLDVDRALDVAPDAPDAEARDAMQSSEDADRFNDADRPADTASGPLDVGESETADSEWDPGIASRDVAGDVDVDVDEGQRLGFERLDVPPLTEHWCTQGNPAWMIGFGIALGDVDGDRDLDVYVTGDTAGETHGCLYENRSTPGELRFQRRADLCGPLFGQTNAALAVDFDGDGVDSLVLLGVNRVLVWDRGSIIDLFSATGTQSLGCVGASGVPLDVDHDGRLELVVGCQGSLRSPTHGHLVFTLTPDEGWALVPVESPAALTLATATSDVDGDGLLDLLLAPVAVQHVVGAGQLPAPGDPGGVLLGTPNGIGDEPIRRFGPEGAERGAFMGVARFSVAGSTSPHFALTDAGSVRVLRWDRDGFVVLEDGLGIRDRRASALGLSWWAALTDDWNRDGRADLFLSQGVISDWENGELTSDNIFLQDEDGRFVVQADALSDLGSSPSGTTAMAFPYYASRGAVRADLDHDGRGEILVASLEGHPRVYRERIRDGSDRRCTLIPHPSLVPTHGSGVAIRAGDGSTWSFLDAHGQYLSAGASHIAAPFRSGELRFASGAVVPFDCGDDAGPLDIYEPQWLLASTDAGKVVVELDERVWLGDITTLSIVIRRSLREMPCEQADDGPRWNCALTSDDVDQVMVVVNGTYIGRWLTPT